MSDELTPELREAKERYEREDPDPDRELSPELKAVKAKYYETYPNGAPEQPLDPALEAMKAGYEQRPVIPEDLNESAKVAVDVLRREWGGDFDKNYNAAMDALGSLPAEQAEEVLKSYEGLANDPDMLDVLAQIGRGKWDGISPALLQKIEDRYPGIGRDARVESLVQQLAEKFQR